MIISDFYVQLLIAYRKFSKNNVNLQYDVVYKLN